MKRNRLYLAALVVVVLTAAATGAAVAVAPAKSHTVPGPPPDAVLTWNTYAVNAVRASTPTKFQTDGMVYMAYVQAAVYDAVTKIDGKYEPYHDFAFTPAPGASVQAAVAAAARTVLNNYLPDQQPTVDAEYNAYLATLSGGVADGVAAGNAAANDLIAFRTGDGLKASTPAYGQIGPIIPGKWQLQSPTQTAQTPWLATLRPFLLDGASQFRAAPPPAITSGQYAKDLNETETYGAVNSSARSKDQTDIAYFWNGNGVNQFNVTMQNVVAQHDMDIDDAAHLFGDGNDRHRRRGHRLLRLEVLLRGLAADHGDPERRHRRQPRHDRRPELVAAPHDAGASRVPVAARLLHGRASPRRSRRRWEPATSMSRCRAGRTAAPTCRSRSTSRPSTTSRSRRSTPVSGSASTSGTRSSRARSSATGSPTGSSIASSSPLTRS